MTTQQDKLIKALLEARDICYFTSDYLLKNLHQFKIATEQHLIYAISSNLNRSGHKLEMEMLALGINFKDRPYSVNSFQNLSYLEADLLALVDKYITQNQERKKQQKEKGARLTRLLFR
ncbi:hypothetical protein [Aliikangiella sp. G2MR2-5]|uniref:hypothetical protein n=1 Tax=Aliikangiella sp. G2MR2-5 TaxID=2788943 RepID=UPI0018A974B0|nr:hypothetical protein [Aliikangiella sp. G2MR2-5]